MTWRSLFKKKAKSGGGKSNNNSQKPAKKKRTNQIDDYLEFNEQIQQRTISLLLLGPGGSGKSTVLKQMEKIYNGIIPEAVLEQTSLYIRQKNILCDIKELCKKFIELKAKKPELKLANDTNERICTDLIAMPDDFSSTTKTRPQMPLNQHSNGHHTGTGTGTGTADTDANHNHNHNHNHNNDGGCVLTLELAARISLLWSDPAIQATYDILKKAHIMDNTPYFFNEIQRIAQPNYSASFEDYIRVRHRTTGITETSFDISMESNSAPTSQKPSKPSKADIQKMWRFKFTDVGGQRTERKKWVRCFTDIHAVIYVMSLAGYDQVLFEEHNTNCFNEAFEVFGKTFRNPALAEVDVIVFLNKNDLFSIKIQSVPFTVFDPTFDPSLAHNPQQVIKYVRQAFRGRYRKSNSQNQLHFHVTSATDTSQISTIMTVIQLQQIRKCMKSSLIL